MLAAQRLAVKPEANTAAVRKLSDCLVVLQLPHPLKKIGKCIRSAANSPPQKGLIRNIMFFFPIFFSKFCVLKLRFLAF